MHNSFGNTILVIILVLLVAFGVWYFTSFNSPNAQQGGLEVNIGTQQE